MARTILITAGTSLLENLRQPGPDNLYDMVTKLELPSYDRMADLLGQPGGKWVGVPRRTTGAWWFIDYYGRRSPKSDRKDHAAELSSLALLKPTGEDEIVFLCSDTPEGLFCGLVIAHLIKPRDDMIRVHVASANPVSDPPRLVNWEWKISDASVPHFDIPRAGYGRVSVRQIAGLHPTHSSDFVRRGAANLISAFTLLARGARDRRQPLVLNFTGGYKATVPLLTIAASWLVGADISLVALYQESADLLQIPLIVSAPDRALWDELQDDLERPDITVDGLIPAGKRPLAKDKPGGGIQLSLLGQAMQAYFKMIDE